MTNRKNSFLKSLPLDRYEFIRACWCRVIVLLIMLALCQFPYNGRRTATAAGMMSFQASLEIEVGERNGGGEMSP